MGLGLALSRLLVLSGNFLFLLLGLAFLVLGLYVRLSTIAGLLTSGMTILPVLLALIGAALFFISLLGFCGACNKNRLLLTISFLVILALVLGQIALTIGGIVERNDIPNVLQEGWDSLTDSDKNTLQKEFDCCGFTNSTDAPGSVCPVNTTTNVTTTEGCGQVLQNFIESRFLILIGIVLALIVLQILGMILTCCLISGISSSIKEKEEEKLLNDPRFANRHYLVS